MIYSAERIASEIGCTPDNVRKLAVKYGKGETFGRGGMYIFNETDLAWFKEARPKPGRKAKEARGE